MADEEAEKKDEESNEPKEPSAMGPLLALIGVFLIGVILILGIMKVLNVKEDQSEGQTAGTTLNDQKPLIERATPLVLGDIMVNVKGEGGRRYVKATVELWYPNEMKEEVEEPEIQNRIMQAASQRLATFDMRELNSEFAIPTISRAFMDQINKELRTVYGTVGTDTTYVEDVVITQLLTQ